MALEFTSVIWDWNGTLLDDVDICIDTINFSLGKRDLPLLTKDQYRDIFTFPVIEYYEKAGFDFKQDSFDDLSHEFIELYLEKLKGAMLFQEAKNILAKFEHLGYQQFILSAMEQTSLEGSLQYFGIDSYFKEIKGTSDIYAYGKLQNARMLMEVSRIDPSYTCLIGDTLHDLEVATQIGCHCLLISAGHQSHSRLKEKYSLVAKTMNEVLTLCKLD